jgi:hypothetical protein
MLSKPIGIAAFAVATVAAAGLGSYLALRPTTQAAPAAVAATPAPGTPAPSTPPATPGPAPVSETEAVVTPPTSTPAPATPVEAPRATPEDNGSAVKTPARPARTEPREARRPAPARTPAPASTPSRREPPVVASNTPAGPASSNPGTTPAPVSETARASDPPAPPIEPAHPLPPPEPPKPTFVEYVLPAEAVMGLQIENTVTSKLAKVEDRVDARVTRDVRVGGEVAVPAGSRVRGNVTLVEQGGKFKEQARLGIRFHTIVLADGSTVPINTETIYRDGDAVAGRSAAKIGGAAVGGAIIGAILGGGKGAAIGAGVGAGAGTGATMAGDRSEARMQAGSTVTVRLAQPATVRVEKEN